jgi:hypothetical protein
MIDYFDNAPDFSGHNRHAGSRFLQDSTRKSKSVPGFRSLGNRAVNWYATTWTGTHLTDVLTGIKVWRNEVTNAFRLQSDDYCYEVELVIKAIRKGFRVKEIPVTTEARLHGKSSVNTLKTGFDLLRKIPQFRCQRLRVHS